MHSASGIAGFASQATPGNMLYSYYGVGYFERIVTPDPVTGKEVGFGFSGLFLRRQSSRAGNDIRIYPHALETRKLRRAAGSHAIFLSHPESLVRGAGRAQERSREYGLS